MKNIKMLYMIASLFLVGATTIHAASLVLDNSTMCSSGNAINGIAIGDVTGDTGGSNECWGTFDGNDPGPSGDGFDIGGNTYNFVAKQNTPGVLEGANIGLVVTPDGTDGSFGTWSYDDNLFNPAEFLIVLKAANSPGYAVWLFTDISSSGDWNVAWTVGGGPNPSNPDLSHFSIYEIDPGGPGPGPTIPEPNVIALLGMGLMGMGLSHRRRKRSTK